MIPHQYIEKNQQGLIQRLQDMIRIQTVNPPGREYREMVDLLERYCQELGMQVEVHCVPNEIVERVTGVCPDFPRYNLIARWDVGAPMSVHFNAHYDVVPATGDWKFGNPFEPGVQNGAIYGRGSGDMKGSIAALLMAVEALQHTDREPAFNVECSFTADEETGGELGAGYVVRQRLVNADYAVVCEGAAGTRVGCGHNGVLWLEIEILGKSAHAANPSDGINAFEAMADLVNKLQDFKEKLDTPMRRYRNFTGVGRSPTINIGGVFGGSEGDKVNTVPAKASFSIDRRILPNETVEQVEKELRLFIDQATGKQNQLKYKVSVPLRIEPCVVNPEHVLPRSFAAVVQAVRRNPAEFRSISGFTDLHYFVEEGGIPGIGYGVNGQNGHAVDERVKLHDVLQTCKVYAEFMLRGVRTD
jgi:succinyl-diaminopimelate desuccinylase